MTTHTFQEKYHETRRRLGVPEGQDIDALIADMRASLVDEGGDVSAVALAAIDALIVCVDYVMAGTASMDGSKDDIASLLLASANHSSGFQHRGFQIVKNNRGGFQVIRKT